MDGSLIIEMALGKIQDSGAQLLMHLFVWKKVFLCWHSLTKGAY